MITTNESGWYHDAKFRHWLNQYKELIIKHHETGRGPHSDYWCQSYSECEMALWKFAREATPEGTK